MTGSLDYVWTYRGAIAVLLVVAFGFVAIVQWLAWIFRRGRFGNEPGQVQPVRSESLRYVTADFLVKIINDFRNLLALVIVGVFAAALAIAMYPGVRHWNVDELGKGVQSVAAALGGLIGSIIGYYFGESAATQRAASAPQGTATTPVQAPPPADAQVANVVVAAPQPPPGQTEGPAGGG